MSVIGVFAHAQVRDHQHVVADFFSHDLQRLLANTMRIISRRAPRIFVAGYPKDDGSGESTLSHPGGLCSTALECVLCHPWHRRYRDGFRDPLLHKHWHDEIVYRDRASATMRRMTGVFRDRRIRLSGKLAMIGLDVTAISLVKMIGLPV